MTDRWYVLRGTTKAALLCAVLALALFVVAGGDKNNAAPQVQDSPMYPPALVSQEPAAAAPISLNCIRLRKGQWLAGAIQHCPDNQPCTHVCWYGTGTQWEAM